MNVVRPLCVFVMENLIGSSADRGMSPSPSQSPTRPDEYARPRTVELVRLRASVSDSSCTTVSTIDARLPDAGVDVASDVGPEEGRRSADFVATRSRTFPAVYQRKL